MSRAKPAPEIHSWISRGNAMHVPATSKRRFDIPRLMRLESPQEQEQTMKTFQTRSPTYLAGGLTLALMAAGTFAAVPPADPDPASKGTPMEDTTVPNTQSTTPYSSSSSATSSDMSSKTISMQSRFDQLDVNHDGYIDKQEAAADSTLSKQFAKLDANKDVKLSITEFANAKGLAMNKKANTKTNNEDSSTKDQYRQ
jgi:hypothetical protein